MTDAPESDTSDSDGPYIDDIGSDELTGAGRLSPTPEQHEQLKNRLHAVDRFDEIRYADRRYLVIGRGGENGPGARRQLVCDLLDDRTGAAVFRLEDFGFTSDDVSLWAPAFDILSAMASHIIGILEDFDGGHVWELGFLYYQQTHLRDILWLLKRIYESADVMRDRYDNGMAASHLAALEDAAADRVITWETPDDLPQAVSAVP